MSPINVAVVVNNLNVGGLENVAIDLIRELESDEFHMHLICLDGAGKQFERVSLPDSRKLVVSKGEGINLLFARADLGRIEPVRSFVADRKIDVLHAHNLSPLLYGGIATRSLWHRPQVIYSEHNQIYRADDYARKKFRVYVNLADEVIVVSHDLRATLVDKINVRPPVNVIHNGIDGERFSSVDGGRVRREFGIGPDEFVVGTAVVHSEQKALDQMLLAAKIVTEAQPDVRFVLAGDGPTHKALIAMANELDLGDRVIFPGYRNDVHELISAFDVYALSSLWEGLPLALLEALAIGRPIVATTVGGNPEVVEDGENGFLVPPRDPDYLADRILALRRDPELVSQIRTANRERFDAHFSLHRMVDAHASLYRRHAAAAHTRNQRGMFAVA